MNNKGIKMQKYLTIMILICSTNAFGETYSEIFDHASKEAARQTFED